MNVEFYQCFSPKLSKHLMTNGIQYSPEYLHKETKVPVRLFFFDTEERLTRCLFDWTNKENLKEVI
ncbi:MAG: hypothetical protein ACRC1P_10975 [Cellulosilyticaceae bacterium]